MSLVRAKAGKIEAERWRTWYPRGKGPHVWLNDDLVEAGQQELVAAEHAALLLKQTTASS